MESGRGRESLPGLAGGREGGREQRGIRDVLIVLTYKQPASRPTCQAGLKAVMEFSIIYAGLAH